MTPFAKIKISSCIHCTPMFSRQIADVEKKEPRGGLLKQFIAKIGESILLRAVMYIKFAKSQPANWKKKPREKTGGRKVTVCVLLRTRGGVAATLGASVETGFFVKPGGAPADTHPRGVGPKPKNGGKKIYLKRSRYGDSCGHGDGDLWDGTSDDRAIGRGKKTVKTCDGKGG